MEDKNNIKARNRIYDYGEDEEKKQKKKNDQIFYIGSFIILLIGIVFYYLMENYYIPYSEVIPSTKIKKPLSDKSDYKLIKLHTGLEILLIHDPFTKSSASSMAINAGSVHDNTIGMAHFCEHMLFLGTKKYPSPSIFTDNLQKYNGVYNAYTDKDKTVYFFEINNDGFIEQLNIFASFFDKPLFNESYVNKEINAINSEHEKNKNNDLFVTDFIVKNEANQNSPFRKFECGNNYTLDNNNKKLTQELKYYFDNFYTNDNMKLVILSNYTIENMTKLIEENFISGYVGKLPKLKVQNKLSYNYYKTIKDLKELPIYDLDKDFTKLIYYKSFDGKNKINFYFTIKSLYNILSKNINPEKYFKYMLKFRGENSFVNTLINKGFINNIKISTEEKTEFYYLYKVSFLLTEKGIDNYILIIKLFFGYINLIKTEGINKEIYDEINVLSKQNFNFKQNKNLFQKVIELSVNLFSIENRENILIGEKINEFYEPQTLFDFIDSISIDNCIIICSINKKTLKNNLNFHDTFLKKILPYYDKDYFKAFINEEVIDDIKTIRKISGEEYNILNNNKTNIDKNKYINIRDIFKLRTKNNFVTKLTDIVLPCYHDYENANFDLNNICKNGEFIPINILEKIQEINSNINIENYHSYIPTEIKTENKNKRLEFWYKIDNSFNIPKENIIIQIKSKLFLGSKANYLMLLLLEKYIEVKVEKYLFEAKDSDNSIKISSFFTNVLLEINCYSDLDERIINIINKIIFTELKVNESNNHMILNDYFEVMKNKVINKIKSHKSQLAFRTTRNRIKKLIFKDINLMDEISIDEINNITIYDFENFIQKFNSRFYMNVIIHGSTDFFKVNKIFELINNNLNLYNNDINFNKNFLEQKELKDNTFLYYYYINDFLGETNHVTVINYQMRLDKSKNENDREKIYDFQKIKIYSSLYSKCIGKLFFTKLRTEKQLGYIVLDTFDSYDEDTFYYSIIVQGTKKFPEEIDLEINEVLQESIKINCNDNFEEIKNSLLFEKKSNENNLEERTEFFKTEIKNMKFNFEEKKQNIEIINSIKDYEEVIKFIKYNFIEKPRRIGILNYANTTAESDVKKRIDYSKISNGLNEYFLKNKNIFTDKIETIYKYLI